MARDEKRRQKALLKKRRKEKERGKRSNPFAAFGPDGFINKVGLIRRAREFPIHECLINAGWEDGGLAHLILSRQQPNKNLVIGVFLVDVFCLGLKNTFSNANISLEEYEMIKSRMFQQFETIACHPKLASRVIYGAIEYADKLGFKPQKDYKLSRFVLDEPSEGDLFFNVKFGKDGKPFYIAGPDDNVDMVVRKLRENAGEGNFDYLYMPNSE